MNLRRLLLALASAALLILAWPPRMLAPLSLIAFIPLLWVIRDIHDDQALSGRQGRWVFRYSWIAFFIWNIACSWWIYNAHWSGMVASTLFNSSVMALIMVLYYRSRKALGPKKALIALPMYWLSFEHIILRWDMSWPWMNLGNVFANLPSLVQWYEFVGTSGGTLWIWLVNLLLYAWVARFKSNFQVGRQVLRLFVRIVIIVLIPMALSLQLRSHFNNSDEVTDVVVVQPNVDPYGEKFKIDESTQVRRILALADSVMDQNVDFVLVPETALPGGLQEGRLEREPSIVLIRRWLAKYPNTTMIIGASTYRIYDNPRQASATARYSERGQYYYDMYNTALQISASDSIGVYHKSQLVVGVEKMPFRQVLKPLLGEVAIDLGGTTGTLGTQEQRAVFSHTSKEINIAPVICWESVFGEYVTEYAVNGADFLGIITNDGWWGDTDGYKQHFAYARLRAIENRRAVARSANTGISGFIDAKGTPLQSLEWDAAGALRQKISINREATLYQQVGDIIGRIALFLAVIFLMYAFVRRRIGSKE
jgi:apolipoprotein N-acyltransferase